MASCTVGQRAKQKEGCPECRDNRHDLCSNPAKMNEPLETGEGATNFVALCCCGGEPTLMMTPAGRDVKGSKYEAFVADQHARRTGIPVDPKKKEAMRQWAVQKGLLKDELPKEAESHV